jgi:hypothetical protein
LSVGRAVLAATSGPRDRRIFFPRWAGSIAAFLADRPAWATIQRWLTGAALAGAGGVDPSRIQTGPLA